MKNDFWAVLNDGADGKHGESEYRVASQFVLDALDGNEDQQNPEDAAMLAESLAGSCLALAINLRKCK